MSKEEIEAAIGALESWGRWIDNIVLICAVGVALSLAVEVVFSVAHWRNENKIRPLRIAQAQFHENELAALHNDTARLSAEAEIAKLENARLQAAMQPRLIVAGIGNRNGDEKVRAERSAAVKRFSGTKAIIQAVPDFEAQKLATAIQHELTMGSGWSVEVTNDIPPMRIQDGVRVVTVEEELFAKPGPHQLTGSNPLVSAAGRAAESITSLLLLDLGPPYGPPLGGVAWSPTSAFFAEAEFGSNIPDGVVLILVGMKPIAWAFAWPVTPLDTPNEINK